MRLKSIPLAVIIIVLLFGGIAFTSAMNWWQTETTKEPVKYTGGEAAGEYNPADIRGSYTFGDVSSLFDIPLADLQAAFRIPEDADPASYPLKSLEALFAGTPVEIGTGSVRLFTAFYKGLPYDLTTIEDTWLLPEAAVILKAQGKMLPGQAAYLESHTVPEEGTPTEAAPAAATQPVQPQATPAGTEHAAPEMTITGKTTFQNLLDWGVPQPAIEAVLGEAMPNPAMIIKDYATSKGQEFSGIKSLLQAEVDKVK